MSPDRPSQAPPPGPRPTDRAAGASRYAPPAPPFPIDLRLDANEGVPPALSLDALARAHPAELLRRYPDARPLEEALARHLGVTPAQVMVTAGGDEAIDRTCRAFLEPGRELIVPTPTFEMIPRYARLTGAAVQTVPWLGPTLPVAEMLARVSPSTAMIAVVSPNNPTGSVATAADLSRLSHAAPHALLLVDQAYTEFADVDLTPAALSLPNAIVVRTFSKAFGLAGLRVGYAIGPTAILDTLRAAAGPYSVSGLSLAAALSALETSPGWLPARVSQVRAERAALADHLRALGARAWDSQGNFVLAQVRDAGATWLALARQGISVRKINPASGVDNALRITCPCDTPALDRLLSALTRALSEPPLGSGGR